MLLTAAYSLFGLLHFAVGLLGMCFPFGVLGDYTPFYSSTLGINETELMTIHLCRMCQVTSFCLGCLFLALRNESTRIRALLLGSVSLASMIFSLGEILLDVPRAQRLGIDNSSPEKYPRAVQFLIGCLDGGSHGTLAVAAMCCLVSTIAVLRPPATSAPTAKRE